MQLDYYAIQHGDRIRAALQEILGQHGGNTSHDSMLHIVYIDSRSLTDHLLSQVPRQVLVADKRLAIETAGLRRVLWQDDTPSHAVVHPCGDVWRWIPTHLQLGGYLTKSMKPHLLKKAIQSNIVEACCGER